MNSEENSANESNSAEEFSATLELNYKRLTSLPEFITQAPYADQIQQLYLKRNFLTTLPQDVRKLSNLTLLYIPSNNLESLPESLCELKSLTCLNVDSNHLMALPERIGDLTSLKKLQASRNYLTELPLSLGHLVCLSTLEMMFNKLTTLPSEIGQLVSLEVLNVDSNYLFTLPMQICHLDKLLELSVCSNQLLYLPQGLSSMKNLTYLLVDNNSHLTSIPACHQVADLGITGCGSSTFDRPTLNGFEHIRIESDLNVHLGNSVVLLPAEIQRTGNGQSECVTRLKEFCLRRILTLMKLSTGGMQSSLTVQLQGLLPKNLASTIAEPTAWCALCRGAILVMAFPVVFWRTSKFSKIFVLELCCTFNCWRRYYNVKKAETSILYPHNL